MPGVSGKHYAVSVSEWMRNKLIFSFWTVKATLCYGWPSFSNRAYFERLKSGISRTLCVFISTGHGEGLYPAFYGFRIFAKEWENIAYEMIGKVKSFDPR